MTERLQQSRPWWDYIVKASGLLLIGSQAASHTLTMADPSLALLGTGLAMIGGLELVKVLVTAVAKKWGS